MRSSDAIERDMEIANTKRDAASIALLQAEIMLDCRDLLFMLVRSGQGFTDPLLDHDALAALEKL